MPERSRGASDREPARTSLVLSSVKEGMDGPEEARIIGIQGGSGVRMPPVGPRSRVTLLARPPSREVRDEPPAW